MDGNRTNAGYLITASIPVGNVEFVLGVDRKGQEKYVTWECRNKTEYSFGHYTDSLFKATKDLCQRAMAEVQYLEQHEPWEIRRDVDFFLAKVEYQGNHAAIQFPTRELPDLLGSIGITLPPERVYLGSREIKVQLQRGGDKFADALVSLFQEDNSLRMVNEVAKEVLCSDWRVKGWLEERVGKDTYHDIEDVLRDAVMYKKYLKDAEERGKKSGWER